MFHFLIAVLCFMPFISGKCAKDGVKWQNQCYTFVSKPAQCDAAEMDCKSKGGHLVSIHDGFANTFLIQQSKIKFINATEVWIGATNSLTFKDSDIMDGQFMWMDGTDMDYLNWYGYGTRKWAPNGVACGFLRLVDSRWDSEDFHYDYPYICEISEIN
uniref:C-type lectin domain-containing protein n=1 Tax=Panagrolaimus sp. PS1159 TaxID=55785 RepID=A0AC35FV88_9BILA